MQDLSIVRKTSQYTLRVQCDREGADVLLDRLAAAATVRGAAVTDTHVAAQDGVRYVSITLRVHTSDADARTLTADLLTAAETGDRETYLYTGLGAHRRLIWFNRP